MDSTVNQTSLMEENQTQSNCEYAPQLSLEGRFWLVVVLGTLLAAFCAFENLLLFGVLCQKKQNRHSLVLYILLLALFDFLIAAFYIPLMSVSVLADYFLEPAILNAWYRYMRPLITICHISMTASAFLILAASFERFCVTCWTSKTKFVNNFRQAIAGLAIFLGFITKISMYFEFNIIHEESCVGTMAEFGLSAAPIVYNYYYNLFWKIGFRNLVTIWVPFFLLLIMNLKIIHAFRHIDVEPVVKQKLSEIQRKNRVRTATRTLVLIVCTYLMANVLNVIITLWEYVDHKSLTSDNLLTFYTYGVDIVSILTVLSGAFRPLIYMACMPQIRRDVLEQLNQCAGKNKYKPDELKDTDKFGISAVLLAITNLLTKYPNFSRTSIDSNITDETEKASGEVFL